MSYQVSKNAGGSTLASVECETLREAIAEAARLARVTPRTVSRRIREWSHPSSCYQVGGREIGDAGVWIEY